VEDKMREGAVYRHAQVRYVRTVALRTEVGTMPFLLGLGMPHLFLFRMRVATSSGSGCVYRKRCRLKEGKK